MLELFLGPWRAASEPRSSLKRHRPRLLPVSMDGEWRMGGGHEGHGGEAALGTPYSVLRSSMINVQLYRTIDIVLQGPRNPAYPFEPVREYVQME